MPASEALNCVVMFPYPSGAGLHLGHFYNYAIVDSWCRWQRHKGHEVSQPFGYDAFGLPAENYARQIGGDPAEVTATNIERFRAQMIRMNTLFDERLITCDLAYVRWTQFIFTLMLERGLAYKQHGVVNWCVSCETVLANEQVQDGHCERCKSPVEPRELDQWYFAITKYKDRLLAGLEGVDMPDKTRKMQRSWLKDQRDWCVSRQRRWGCPIPVPGETDTLDTFVDSSFYFLRYLTDSQDEFLPAGAYRPVDLYVGGPEHATMHLIYARFVHMVLFDAGIVPQEEPFNRIFHQGMITRNGAKMSKSAGNAVDPDQYDPDELRMHLMFIGPYADGGEWSDANITGIRKFFGRMRRWLEAPGGDALDFDQLEAQIDRAVETFKFNLVVSGLMTFYNANKGKRPTPGSCHRLWTILKVFAPGLDQERGRTDGYSTNAGAPGSP